MDIQQSFQRYMTGISSKYTHEETSEMGYRKDFEELLEDIFSGRYKRIAHDEKAFKGNKPDYVIYKEVPILYIEVKDIGISLDKIEKSEQMARYYGYANLVLTDYVEFRFYRNGERYDEPIKIAEYDKVKRHLTPDSTQYERLVKTLIDFSSSNKEPIKSGMHLAKILGGRASRIRDNVKDMLMIPDPNSDLKKIYEVVRVSLIADLNVDKFADMYAQTLVYGLFVARYYDKTPDDFTRQEARDLLPATNPFLRSFFDHIAGINFPNKMKFIVDELCEIFSYSNIANLLHDTYGYEKERRDPIIHFYEDFLKEYDSQMKMELGVFYTPKEVVQFIVRSVDELLKTEFGLNKGLTDISKVKIKVNAVDGKGKSIKIDKDFHKVQILDIATGTGSFLNETILLIYKSFENNKGSWESYVKEELIPRLHGFELMMASYTIAHLKLGMTLGETGINELNKRLGVYLTNTLEEGVDNQLQGTLFGLMESIAEESREASRVKNELPIMVVIGNPPYSGISMNKQYKGNEVYKVEPGGKQRLQEKKNWLDDDYVKFIRFSESLIEKNGAGIIGMITSHGYIDNVTFRGMRWHLRKTFNKIYVLDLHGNSNKKEISPDGSKDENVFDIKTGVAIIFAVKNGNRKDGLGKILKFDLFGNRNYKFDILNESSINKVKWEDISNETDMWVKKHKGKENYEKGFRIDKLFINNSTGILTMGDGFIIDSDKDRLKVKIEDLLANNYTEDEFKIKYSLGKNYSKWVLENKSRITFDDSKILCISYRPFDNRFTYFDSNTIWRTRKNITKNFINVENIGLVICRQTVSGSWNHITITKLVSDDSYLSNRTKERGYILPLYNYDSDGIKSINLNSEITKLIYKVVGEVSPENIFDYIYAVLHSPDYRKENNEFLKTDFPRVPYPENKEKFLDLAFKGKRLRQLHLIESSDIDTLNKTLFNISGNNLVEKLSYEENKVYINSSQYFDNVSEVAWNFYIGGYQPAQKWLKDRKGIALSYEDIEHYRKIITVLDETDKIMKELDK